MISDASEHSPNTPFLPDLCTLQAVFLLVFLGELLALSLSVAATGIDKMSWLDLGLRTFFIQWVVLLSAALLCPLRSRLAHINAVFAGFCCYVLVLAVTLGCYLLGQYFLLRHLPAIHDILNIMILAAILAGVVLRYLFIQQQLHNQQQAELNARIQALQYRIRPHFLFNSLNSIASLVATEPDTAESMIEDLASLFRASLSEPGLIPLADELELCHQYVAIEQRRLGSRLVVRWDKTARVRRYEKDIKIPSLLLQPLIENAVHHGVQPRLDGGTVDIQMTLEDTMFEVVIRNPVPDEASEQGNRMALSNIEHRLQAHYGGAARFFAGFRDEFFEVSIAYPFDVSKMTDTSEAQPLRF